MNESGECDGLTHAMGKQFDNKGREQITTESIILPHIIVLITQILNAYGLLRMTAGSGARSIYGSSYKDFPGNEKEQHRAMFKKLRYRGPKAFLDLRRILWEYWPAACDVLTTGCDLGDNFRIVPAFKIARDEIMGTYEMNKKDRGILAFVNNYKYNSETLKYRTGASEDEIRMKNLFREFYFDVDTFYRPNLTKENFLVYLKEVKSSPSLLTKQCLVFIVASHGDGDNIAFTDGTSMNPHEIIQEFGNKACPGLKGKPKIFIFVYCRGNQYDQGIRDQHFYFVNDFDVIDGQTEKKYEGDDDILEDMIVCYSTLPSEYSARHPDSGSIYLDAIYEIFAKHASKCELKSLLRKVARKTMQTNPETVIAVMAEEDLKLPIKQTPQTDYYNFNYSFYFNPGVISVDVD